MRAVILENGILSLRDVAKPVPRPEEALIRVTATGVCHSDVHLVKGDWPRLVPPVPIPMGHEGIGIVEELGAGGERFVSLGDRVILGLGGTGGGYWCGACEFCLSGRPRLCSEAKGVIGTFAEYIAVWAKSLVRLPETLSDMEVPLACGGLTAYGAIKKLHKFGVLAGKPIAIVGAAGGLGHYAVQLAKAFGYKVVGIDVGEQRKDFVMRVGADYALDVNEAVKFVKDYLGGVYASVVFAPKIAGFELGIRLLRRGGLLICVGMPPSAEGGFSISPLELLRKDIIIMSSAVGTVDDMRELIQLAAEGKVKTHVGRVAKLSEIEEVIKELDKGVFPGRAVITDLKG